MHLRDGRGREVVGAWLASSAHLQAASVRAFASVTVELRRFGAPDELSVRAQSALRDEVRHARVLSTLAARRGAPITPPAPSETPVRELLAFAVYNVVEGCVRETWAALVAHFQALHASDREIAAAFARIAIAASRHAELGADIDRWVHGRLAVRHQVTVAAARRRALTALSQISDPDPDLQRIAGLPSAGTARRLLRGLTPELWDTGARAA